MPLCLVAARDADARERTARVLKAEFDRTVTVGLDELLVTVARVQPDVVVVAADSAPPDEPGSAWVAALGELRAAAPQLAVLVTGPSKIGHDAEHQLATTALNIGAQGFLRSGTKAGAPLFGAENHSSAPALSDRELQVLLGMTEGLTNAEIAASLTLASDTVKTHARRLFRKLGAEDRAHAVARGFRQGILR